MRLFSRGSDDDDSSEEIGTDVLNTPIPKTTIEQVQKQGQVQLEDRDDPLVDILESIQEYVDSFDYENDPAYEHERVFGEVPGELVSIGAGQGGNAFVDWLKYETEEESLIEPRMVTADELLFVATEEVWAHFGQELDLSKTEVRPARDTHNIYGSEKGLTASMGHSLMAITVAHDQLRRFTTYQYVDDEEFHESQYEAERRQD